ncbi:Mur ligase family protein [Nonomuraea antimicrobica]
MWSEIEFGAILCPHPITAVTGTNSKSTTTALIGELMRAADHTAYVAGNIGYPLTAAFTGMPTDGDADAVAVVEVSAGQLEDCHAFKPHIAVLTNVRPEHMDRYTWDEYVAAKSKIVRNHTPADITVANFDDEWCRQIAERSPGRTVFFSALGPLPDDTDGVFVDGSDAVAHHDDARIVLWAREELRVPGALPNLLAMAAAGLADGIAAAVIRDVAVAYTGREHVIEHVATVAAVDYVNDSKATNPWSIAARPGQFRRPARGADHRR